MITPAPVGSITPQTDIVFLQAVQCELLEDTLYFSSASEQYNYFYSKRISDLTFTQNTPVTIMGGVVNVKAVADHVLDANYVMIRNQNFSPRWWYCVITSVEYLSLNSCQVRFQVDAVQTFFFDYQIENAFIIREHVSDDIVGAHTVPEGLEIGEYVCQNLQNLGGTTGFTDTFSIVIFSTYNQAGSPVDGGIVGGMYSGVEPQVFGSTPEGVTAANNFLESLVEGNKSDAIIAVLWVPNLLALNLSVHGSVSRPTNLDGYTPTNKKLLTYPYINCVFSNNQGTNTTLRFEFSGNANGSIGYYTSGKLSGNPSAITVPSNYRGIDYDITNRVVMSNFPMCAYAIDSYKAWQAMNGGSISAGVGQAQNVVSATAGGASSGAGLGAAIGSIIPGLGTAAGGLAGGIIGGLAGAITSLGQVQATLDMPLTANQGSGNIQFQLWQEDEFSNFAAPCAYVQTIKAEYAKMIDDFFTMYGYKVNRRGIPSRNNRTTFTYCQCSDIRIGGDVPQVYLEQIANRYKQGIRFWKSTANFLNYSANNAPMKVGD